ncbi:hypothetical protein P280DRAFT_71078 [Massarina eburnea CBS 473.64]|uniref:Uncharacterized protein n=1 Tax=Massarina eburnea CBS 473.64 TaxID=1395130 RepID=A0A6A6RU05_9PLEO|nr:hypothetical protein P280DRAFT_71078 [Massarina eburnea CBS 473.64]
MALKIQIQLSEKASLLPIAEQQPPTRHEDEDDEHEHSSDLRSATLIYASLVILVALILLLNTFYLLPSDSPLAPYAVLIATGIRTSAWASLPAPVVLFIYAPYLAQSGKVAQMRYLTFLFYLVGTCVGGLMFGVDLKEAVMALGRACRVD